MVPNKLSLVYIRVWEKQKASEQLDNRHTDQSQSFGFKTSPHRLGWTQTRIALGCGVVMLMVIGYGNGNG